MLLVPFSYTISLYGEFVELSQTKHIEPKLSSVVYIDRSLLDEDIDRAILELVANFEANSNVKVIKVSPSIKFDENEYVSTYTKDVTLEGEFKSILRYLSNIEKNMKGIKIVSLRFFTVNLSQKINLNALVTFQSISLVDDE